MSILARVRMEFNCYDVLEVHGSRYVITEKIKYIEIIPKADKEQSYRGQPSMTMIMNGVPYLEHPFIHGRGKILHYIKSA